MGLSEVWTLAAGSSSNPGSRLDSLKRSNIKYPRELISIFVQNTGLPWQVNVGETLDKIVDEWTYAQFLDHETYMERMVGSLLKLP